MVDALIRQTNVFRDDAQADEAGERVMDSEDQERYVYLSVLHVFCLLYEHTCIVLYTFVCVVYEAHVYLTFTRFLLFIHIHILLITNNNSVNVVLQSLQRI